MLQHGTRGLRATAAESAIELVNVLGMRASVADEDDTACVPVDGVHDAEHIRCSIRSV
jgi:hypothetical protein